VSAIRPASTAPGTFLCPRCGSTLRDDQDWCLECGLAARTRIHPPPSWRVPVVLTGIALALLAAGSAFALVTLLDTPKSTPPPATVTVPAASAPATTLPPSTVQTATTPQTTVPQTTVPQTTVPTTPTATAPSNASPNAFPRTGSKRTLRVPGARITLPANGK
jgi:hypothetical protein